MAIISSSIALIKKNRILFVSVLAVIALVCGIFAFIGQNSEIETSSEAEITPVDQSETELASTASGYGIYIDGYLVSACETEQQAKELIGLTLNNRLGDSLGENVKAEFANSINYIKGEYDVNAFVGDASSLLASGVYNYNGELLPVTLSVKTVTTYSENVIIAYDSKTVYTDALDEGTQKVVDKGYDGEGIQTVEIVSVDGVETNRTVVDIEVITPAVDELVRVGTRSASKDVASIGKFLKPYDGIISSYYGYRWGRMHNGLDICQNGGCFKDPAYAAADGVVISAKDSNNGYGNCVIIDHGNGVTTLYAHFHSLLVKEGDVVKAGDAVGLIGSTGYSYGPHLHFEVRIDDVPVNPLMFVDYE